MQNNKQIAIIGAGPSGLMAAELLATCGYSVTIYDRMASPARKLLIAGRGGLNLTHSEPLESFITRYGTAADWLAPSLHQFTPADLRAWCDALGQETFVGSSGRVFPRAMKAVSLLRSWLRRLDALGVQFKMRHQWLRWQDDALRFSTQNNEHVYITPDATLLALGGASWPRLGSNGVWVSLLADAGIAIEHMRPANCGFVVPWTEHFANRFAGEPLKPVKLTCNGVSRQGEAMITKHGLEGGVIYAMSALIRDTIESSGRVDVTLDLRPGISLEIITKKLQIARGNLSLSNYLRRAGLSPLVIGLLREVIAAETLSSATAHDIAEWLKALPLTFSDHAGMARAISTAGGIKQTECSQDLMLYKKPGVFVAGEMLDWEAPTGGYLLQACFSTAVTAADGIKRFCMN